MYSYFIQLKFIKVFIIFVLAQLLGSGIAVGVMELFPSLSSYPDVGFELLRTSPNILLILWFLYDMKKKKVNIMADFQQIRKQIEMKDLFSILTFNILIGLFSIYAIIYCVVNFLPADAMGELSKSNGLTGQKTFAGILVAAGGAIFIAPFAEEFIFRGVLFTKFMKKLPIWTSMILSSVLFGAIHFSISAITTFLFAISLCIVFYKTKNIAIAIILHIFNNTFVSGMEIMSELFSKSSNEDMSLSVISTQFYTIGIPCLIVSILLAYYLIQKRDFLKLNKPFMVD